MTQSPTEDRDMQHVLDAYSVPNTTPDFGARVVAEATRSGRMPTDARRPVRAARRPWMRRSIIAGVIAINLFAASAIAAIIGGHTLIQNVATFTHRLIAPTHIAPAPQRPAHPAIKQTHPRSLPEVDQPTPTPTPIRAGRTVQGLAALPVIHRSDIHTAKPVSLAEVHRPVRRAVRRADRLRPDHDNEMTRHRAMGERFERHRNDRHLAPGHEIAKDRTANADRLPPQNAGVEQERARPVDEREGIRPRSDARDTAEVREQREGAARNSEPSDAGNRPAERSARGGGKRRWGAGRRFGRRRG